MIATGAKLIELGDLATRVAADFRCRQFAIGTGVTSYPKGRRMFTSCCRPHAFVRLDRGYGGVGSFVQQGANEAAAVGTDVEQRKRVRRVAMAQHGIDGDLGAETLAVAHVAPIGAARYGRGRAWSAVGARQALHQPAFRANVHADVS